MTRISLSGFPTVLETKRLILRPWKDDEADAQALFRYASDPEIGPNAGWLPHESVIYSGNMIRTILKKDGIFAITRKGGDNEAIGSIGLTMSPSGARGRKETEAELGYWIGRPYQNQGLTTEAVREMLRYAFCDRQREGVWCCYYDGNLRSRHVMDKTGFTFDHTDFHSFNPMMDKYFVEHFMYLPAKRYFNYIGKML